MKSIKNRMICVYLLLSIVPILIIGSVAYKTSTDTIIQQVVKIHEYNIDTYSRSISTAFKTLRRATQDFLYGEQASAGSRIVPLLEKPRDYYDKLSIYKQHELIKTLDERVERLIPYNFVATKVVLDNRKGFHYSKSYSGGEAYTDIETNHSGTDYEEIYHKALLTENKEVFVRLDEHSFVYMRIIYSLNDFNAKGFLLLEVESSILESVLPVGEELDNVAYVVVDTIEPEFPQIVFATGEMNEIDKLIWEYYKGNLDTDKKWTIGNMHNDASGWDIFYLADTSALAEKAQNINRVTISMVFIMCGIVILLGIWLAHIINRPLEKLGNAIRRVDEEGDYRITETFGEDEIGQIGQQFSRMVEQNLALKDSLYLTEIKQKEAELIALQAQINPHFLYNTLDAIYLMTQMGRSSEAGEMTLALSEMFRTSLNKGQEFTKVRDEMKHIGNYLYIQQKRYGNKINYQIDIDDELMEEKMLKLVLQPIIENAIYHGLEPKALTGILCITGTKNEQHMLFRITDDGVGMEHEEWKNGYGLTNVRERLKLYYGEAYDLKVESRIGEGTSVEVRIPVVLPTAEQGFN